MLQQLLAIWVGKLIFFLSRNFKVGGGSAAPGLYALKIEPDLVKKLASKIPQNIVITGTNGKTTTARMLDHLVKHQGLKTVRNSTGSNLERGVASALIEHSNILGQIKDVDLGIWELDEAAFNKVVFQIKPQIVVFLNAFRDQLDRYGEVDSVVRKWWATLGEVNWDPTIIVNGGDTNTATLTAFNEDEDNPLKVLNFRVRDHMLWHESSVTLKEKDSTKKTPLSADFMAVIKKNLGLNGTQVKVSYPEVGSFEITIPIPGVYHIYDFLAAFSVYYLLNLPLQDLEKSLKSFEPAFGRVEHIQIKQKDSYIFLIKNPAGANTVFETINPEIKVGDTLLLALNDNFADGTDVSWIWDAEMEILLGDLALRETIGAHYNYPDAKKRTEPLNLELKKNPKDLAVFVSGTRAYDMALRLKYAGFNNLKVVPELGEALKEGVSKKDGRLFILPTYTALLELQKILASSGAKAHYWKE